MEDPHREFCRRQHRVLGHYLAIQAWVKGLDCPVVEREQLGKFLGLERFKGKRIEWLSKDLRPWFRYFYDLCSLGSFAGVFLSRKQFPESLGSEYMNDEERTKALAEVSIVADKLERMPKEDEVVSYPALWAVGLDTPIKDEDIPPPIYNIRIVDEDEE